MKYFYVLIVLLSTAIFSACGKESDESQLPQHEIDSVLVGPVDTVYGKAYPIDAQEIETEFELDSAASQVNVVARIEARIVSDDYKPLFAIPSDARDVQVEIDGTLLSAADIHSVDLPESASSRYHVLNESLTRGTHQIHVRYALTNRGQLLSDYADINGKGLQAYVPCNPMLYDRFTFSGKVSVVNDAGKTYRFYSNGTVRSTGTNSWTFEHSSRVNALAPYFHLLNASTVVGTTTRTFNAINGPITVTAYRTDSTAANTADAADLAVAEIARLESLLGPYAHGDKFTIYLEPGRGGMEFAGATISSLAALKHEVFHSWFATGVFPRYYSDAWLDEALARWFDNANPATALNASSSVRLAGYSPYDLRFPTEAYAFGSQLIAHLAHLAGGSQTFIALLGAFFELNKLKTVTTEEFRDFVELWLKQDLDAFFMAYVYRSKARVEDEPVDSAGAKDASQEEAVSPFRKEGLEAPLESGLFL